MRTCRESNPLDFHGKSMVPQQQIVHRLIKATEVDVESQNVLVMLQSAYIWPVNK